MSLVEKRLAILERQNSDQRALIARLENELAGLRAFKHAVRQSRLVVQGSMLINHDDVTPEILGLFRESVANEIGKYLLENGLLDFEEPDLAGVYRAKFNFVPGRVLKAGQL